MICSNCSIDKYLKDGVYFDKDQNGVTNVGDTVIYTLLKSNTGDVALTNVAITEIIMLL
jgi:hypothetical protein